jgi:hypothetical protein
MDARRSMPMELRQGFMDLKIANDGRKEKPMIQMSARVLPVVLFGALLGLTCLSSSAQHDTTAAAKAAAQESSVKLADLSWMVGTWKGEWGPRTAEQVWLAPNAGELLGVFRLAENDKMLVIELFTLVERSGGIDFYLRHFTPQLVPWEKSEATMLHLASLDALKIEFENSTNGMPKRASFTRLDADTYLARSEIVPESGEMQLVEITYHRQKPAVEKSSAGSGAHRKKP